jgi:aryl-alcohol dehydrogenase-like predicted oxidoreductase
MNRRRFGRIGWEVGDVGYGMWGLAAWSDSDRAEVERSLALAVESGVNFFDTAAVYGNGLSEQLLGRLVRAAPGTRLYTATKVPPLNRRWPAEGGTPVSAAYPPDHIRESTYRSLERLGVERIDLQQFHVWHDDWADDHAWQEVVAELKREGVVEAWGISVNRWQPANGIKALRTGLLDAVQVIYNAFDQHAEDELFPVCEELDIAVIARVPFDEGSLAGNLHAGSTWPEDDWRSGYFTPTALRATLERVDALRAELPRGLPLAETALRFILSEPRVSTTIPGMRKPRHVRENTRASDAGALEQELMSILRRHRWDRVG